MTPTEFLIQNREAITGVYTAPAETWNKVKFELPEIENIMTYNTFKTLIKPVVETCRFLSNELTSVKNELDKVTQDRDNLQELYNQLYNHKGLDNGLDKPDRLDKELDKLKRELDKVTQERDNLQVLYNQLHNHEELDKPDRLDKVIQSDKNIQGWSIQFSKGYYRGFRKFGRKLFSVYLGKSLDGAENKIAEKEQRLHEAANTSS